MDYREAYKVGGNLYDAEGRLIGPIEQARFIPHASKSKASSQQHHHQASCSSQFYDGPSIESQPRQVERLPHTQNIPSSAL
jgi:hypothetical protein